MLETINLDDGLTTAGQSLAPFGSLFTQSGILRPNSFTVSALSSPGMFVEVSGSDDDDIAIIKTDDGATYFIRNTLDLQVPILANSSGVTKTDAIVLFVDLSAGDDESAGSPGAAQVIAVRRDGVSTGLPNDGEIDAETGNNPWIFLRGVEVEHGAGEVEDEDLGGTPDRAYLDIDLVNPTEIVPGDGTVTNQKLATAAGEVGGEWQSWTPTIGAGGSMTISSLSITRSRYQQVGKTVRFSLVALFTIGGTPHTDITFTLPVPVKNAGVTFPFSGFTQNTTPDAGLAYWSATGIGVVRRPTSANWSTGTNKQIYVSGIYEAE